jgi:hypothetical protein
VNVGEGAVFTMSGGTISGNSAREGGNVGVWRGTFTMSGGSVEGVDPSIQWTLAAQSDFSDYMESVAYGSGRFIAVGRSDNGSKMAYSTDGITWTAVSSPAFDGGFGPSTVTFSNGRFFAVAWNGMAYSTDGVNWTVVIPNLTDIRGPVYGNGRWVIATYEGRIMSSTDGITWTAANGPSGFQYLTITYGAGKFVAGSMSGRMAHSTDGITWTVVSDNAIINNRSRRITYVGGKFLAYEGDVNRYRMAYSADGVTWTAIEGTDDNTRDIAYGGGKFVAVGNGGSAAYSDDGITWTAGITSVFSTTHITGIAYGAGRFVAVGSSLEGGRPRHIGIIAYSNVQE